MKICIVDTYYSNAIESMGYSGQSRLAGDYESNLNDLVNMGFGTGGAYARGLRLLGVDVEIIIPNALGVQELWRPEQGFKKVWRFGWKYGLYLARLPLVRDLLVHFPHMHRLVWQQIVEMKPDVVLVQDINFLPKSLVRRIKKHVPVVIGEIASPPPPRSYFEGYDLIFSALPSLVEQVKQWGITAKFLPLAFDSARAHDSKASDRDIDVVFIGSFSRHQSLTLPLLAAVAKQVPSLQIYGTASAQDLATYELEPFFKGQAWGDDMFALLRRSKIVVNRHGDIAGDYAVNMRMYEATGSGCVLVTEAKKNLADLFEPGCEVIAYESVEDAATQIVQLLSEPERLDAIAHAGYARTMRDHTYEARATVIAEVCAQMLKSAAQSK